MKDRRKGFTLVELLIVMVVIGILSAMMMFSSTEAEISAKAQNIINNFNQIQKAVNSWYFDNLNRVVTDGKDNNYIVYKITDANGNNKKPFKEFIQKNSGEITKYLSTNNPIKLKGKEETIKAGDYILIDDHYKWWYVCYDTGSDKRLQSKLAGRAKLLGLYGFNNDVIKNSVTTSKNYTGGRYVCMFVLDLDN